MKVTKDWHKGFFFGLAVVIICGIVFPRFLNRSESLIRDNERLTIELEQAEKYRMDCLNELRADIDWGGGE
jgi:hypothetical protein